MRCWCRIRQLVQDDQFLQLARNFNVDSSTWKIVQKIVDGISTTFIFEVDAVFAADVYTEGRFVNINGEISPIFIDQNPYRHIFDQFPSAYRLMFFTHGSILYKASIMY